MKKNRWLNKSAMLLLISFFVILLMGFPVVDKEKTGGISRRDAFHESEFSQIVYKWSKPFGYLESALALVVIALYFYYDYLIKRIRNIECAKRTFKTSSVLVIFVTLLIFLCMTGAVINFVLILISACQALREYTRASFVFGIGLCLAYIYLLFDIRRSQKFFLDTSVESIISNYYLREHSKYLEVEDIEKAGQAIKKSCEIDPQNFSAWVLQAMFADVHLSSVEDTKVFFNKATEILEGNPDISNKEKAQYEMCKGIILLGQCKDEEAVLHFKKSLELDYSRKKANFFKKLKK